MIPLMYKTPPKVSPCVPSVRVRDCTRLSLCTIYTWREDSEREETRVVPLSSLPDPKTSIAAGEIAADDNDDGKNKKQKTKQQDEKKKKHQVLVGRSG